MPFFKVVHFNVAHGWSYRRLAILFFLAKLFRKKTVWHIHSGELDIYYEKAHRLEKYMYRFVLKNADVVLALSSCCVEMIQRVEPNASIKIILNGVNTKDYEVTNREIHTPVKVLLLGCLMYRKGVYDVLKAIELLAGKNIFFVLAGDGDVDGVRKTLDQKGLNDIASVPGWISGDKKLGLLQEADIYILPSYQEGLPISILEAMSAGLPIISTPVGGIPDAVTDGENGYLIEPGDFEALASKILSLSKDQNLWKKFSLRSSEIAKQKFHMSRVETELANMYDSLL